MEKMSIVLTKNDKVILESYRVMLPSLANYLGNAYEIVLHNLENLSSSVIQICGGNHTNRTIGAPITDLGLSMLEKISVQEDKSTGISYFTTIKNGEPLKSSTIPIIGENGKVIALICINFYLNTPWNAIIASYTDSNSQIKEHTYSETFTDSIDDLLKQLVSDTKQSIFNNNDIPANCKNKEIVRLLSRKGIFNFKDAVIYVAKYLNISKNTVYMHMRNTGDV